MHAAGSATPGNGVISILRRFMDSASSGGIVLMAAALAALIVANSPLAAAYTASLNTYVGGLSILHWINDGLMAVFFLLVGLEIKREVIDGQLSTWSRRILPGSAALGGFVVPALIYLAINRDIGGQPNGWAIPAATDIAFALGILSLLGPRVPAVLKIFLMALAIIDDLAAVVVIGLFYTAEINEIALASSAAAITALIMFNRFGVRQLTPYLLAGGVLWFLVLNSGIHATLAGVILAFMIPLRPSGPKADDWGSPLHRLEHRIAPWVTFAIVPIFGFANAGVSFEGVSLATLMHPVPLGIAIGLFVGKQLGVFVVAATLIRLGLAEMPMNANWRQLYGVSLLCGVGFTMSLFIGLLAFPDDLALQSGVKIGVLLGSLLSAIIGATVIYFSCPDPQQPSAGRANSPAAKEGEGNV